MRRKDNLSREYKNDIQDLLVKFSKLKISFYKLVSLLYSPPDFYLKQSKANTFLFYLSHIWITLQLASIIFKPDIQLTGWQNFSILWTTFQYSHFDIVCETLLDTEVCLNIFLSFSLLAGVCFIVMLISLYYNKRTIKLILFYLKIFIIITQLQSISFISMTIKFLKNSQFNDSVGVYVRTLSFFSCIIVIIFEYFHLSFNYEFRHFFSHYNINSRASNKVIWKSKIVLLATVILICLGSNAFFEVTEITCFIINGIIVRLIAKNFPFYQLRGNYLAIAPHLLVSCGSLALIIAKLIKNAFFCILTISLFLPILFWLIIDRMKFSFKNLKPTTLRDIQDIYQFELNYRHLLVKKRIFNNEEDLDSEEFLSKKKMIRDFNYIFYKSKCEIQKVFLLWFTSFCFYNCQLHKVALIKSSLFLKVYPSLEEDFHEYILRKKMYMVVENEYQEYKTMYKYRKLEKLASSEKATILEFLNFNNNVFASDTSIYKLETKMRNFRCFFERTVRSYTVLSAKFPNSLIVLNSFLIMLELFKADSDKENSLNKKVENLKNTVKLENLGQDNYTENSPILLVSAIKKDYGRVIFVNKAFSTLIKQSTESILNTYVQSFFPDSITLLNFDSMKKFKEEVIEDTEYLNCNTLLKLSNWELIEINLIIVLMSYSKGFFLFKITKLNLNREVVHIDKFGVILGFTPGINKLLGNEEEKVGKFISEFLPVSIKALLKKPGNEISLQYPPLLIQYYKIRINNSCARVIYLYSNVMNKEYAKLGISEIITSKRCRKSLMIFQKDSVSKSFYVPKFSKESEKGSRSEENDSLNQKENMSFKKNKRKIELIIQKSSIKIIKMFHLVVVLSIVLICASTIFSMIFLKLEIASITSRKTLKSLASSVNSMKIIADYSYILTLDLNFTESINPLKIQYQIALDQLESSINNFSNFDKNWNFCPDTEKLFKSHIPVYYTQGFLLNINYKTAFQFLVQMISSSKNFLSKLENETNYIQEFSFIQTNSFGPACQSFLKIQKELISCENNIFQNLGTFKIYLLVAGLGVIALCGILCAYLIKSVQVKQQILWKKMIKKVLSSQTIRNRCLAHLSTIDSAEIPINKYKSFHNKKIPKLKFYVRYIFAVSFFLFTGILYYLVAYYLFYSKFESNLKLRLGMSTSLIDSKLSLTSFNYWELNKYLQPYDIAFRTAGYSFFSADYVRSMKNEIVILKNCLNYIKNNIQEVLETGTFFDRIFRSQDNSYYLKKGTVSGIFAWIFDGYYALARQMSIEEEKNYLLSLVDIRKNLDFQYKYYLNDSDERLDKLLNYYINITCCFLIAYFLFYFLCFRLFLRRERKLKIDFEYVMNIFEKAEIDK